MIVSVLGLIGICSCSDDGAPAPDVGVDVGVEDLAGDFGSPDQAVDAAQGDGSIDLPSPDGPDGAAADAGDAAAGDTSVDASPDQGPGFDAPPAEAGAPADLSTVDAGPPVDFGAPPGTVFVSSKVHSELESGMSSTLNRSVARDAKGFLYLCYKTGAAPFHVNVARSTDGGASWHVWASKIDTETYAYNVLGCSLAVDSKDNIYVSWARYSYSPTKHGTYVRKYTSASAKWEALVTVKQINNKTYTNAIAVDAQDYVWLLVGKSNWYFSLWRSDLPRASNGKYTDKGGPASSSYSQSGSMVIDANSNVHVTYYSSRGGGTIYHRYYNNGWKTETLVSATTGGNDSPGPMAADALGNVHILYVEGGGTDNTHYFRHRRWSNGTLAPAVTIFSHTATQHGKRTVANAFIQNLAVTEKTGTVHVVGRNLNHGGALSLYRMALADSAFKPVYRLTANNSGKHYFYMPRMRGTLFPSFNRTNTTIDLSWTENRSVSPAQRFLRIQW